jgi:lathosterol oxidase
MAKFLPYYLFHIIPYLIFTGLLYLLFYILFVNHKSARKIQEEIPKRNIVLNEVFYSFVSIALYSIIVYIIFNTSLIKVSKIYTNISNYSLFYFYGSIIICLVAQDTWFYWLHRFLHTKKVFKHVHLIHHKSINPTPFAAYSFHPVEAILESLIFYILLFIIPLHPLAASTACVLSLLINAYGHLGYEILPSAIKRTFLFKLINSSLYHNMHHKNFKGNFGLYFRFWDKLMGTEIPEYEAKFDEITSNTLPDKINA